MTTGDVEFSENPGSRTFPRIWGRPPGDQWSEERAAWVKDRVNRFAGLRAIEQLERRDIRFLNMLRCAVVESLRNGP